MIKINLLPTRKKAAKKLTPLQQQIIIGCFGIIIEAGILGFWAWSMYLEINDLKGKKAEAEAQIARQEVMLKEVKNVEEEEKKVNEKIATIKKLEENQTGPVRLLDEVSRLLPKGVGLALLAEKAGQVTIEGHAFTNHDLVGFVDNLKSSSYFTDVTLMESTRSKLEGFEVYRYKLQLTFKGAPKGV